MGKKKDVPSYSSVITALSKTKADIIGAAQVSKKEAQKVLVEEANQIDSAISVLAKASPEEVEADVPESKVRVIPSSDFDQALAGIKAKRLKEIESEVASIPKVAKSGELDIPELTQAGKKGVYLHGRAGEIYVKLEEPGDE